MGFNVDNPKSKKLFRVKERANIKTIYTLNILLSKDFILVRVRKAGASAIFFYI